MISSRRLGSGGTAPSCALLAAGAASGEPREVRMTGMARGEIEQSSPGRGSPPDGRPEGREAFWVCAPATEQMERICRVWSSRAGQGSPAVPQRALASADLFGQGDDDARGYGDLACGAGQRTPD